MTNNPTPDKSAELEKILLNAYNRADEVAQATTGLADDKYIAHLETLVDEAKAAIESIIEGRVVAELEKLASMTDSYNGKVQLLANLVSAIYGRLHELKGDQRAQRCPECHGGTYMPGNADPANCDVCHGTGVAQLPASPEDIK